MQHRDFFLGGGRVDKVSFLKKTLFKDGSYYFIRLSLVVLKECLKIVLFASNPL